MFPSDMTKQPSDVYSSFRLLYLISKILGLAPFKYGRIPSDTSIRKFLRNIYNGAVLLLVLGWFVSSITCDSLKVYSKESSTYIIPIVSQISTIFGATITSLIVCHRGTLQRVCTKLLLVDRVLMVPPQIHRKTGWIMSAEILIVFSALGIMHFFDMNGRENYILILQFAGWILSSYINITVLLQFVNCVRILKDRFKILNSQLSEMLIPHFEEDGLNSYLLSLQTSGRLSLSVDNHFGLAPTDQSASLSQHTSRTKSTARTSDSHASEINALRLTYSMLYDLTQNVNSDYGIQILLEMAHSFISLVMSMYVAMTSKADPRLTECDEVACVRVITNFSLATICSLKFIFIAASCHAASDEMIRTPLLVQKLLSPRSLGAETITELQSFSQMLNNVSTQYTASGFFTLNLNLLSSIAAAATTYIVILIQMSPQ
ncbi:putative gustatory receptor 28a [Periplaneta americana]|uniref:putative gustatory receptor 28a n=1 Tax=Periplaneta americana TaxID=6978 RepID=UPI0037E8D2A8